MASPDSAAVVPQQRLPFIKGKDVSLKKGTLLNAYAERIVLLPTPVPPPPTFARVSFQIWDSGRAWRIWAEADTRWRYVIERLHQLIGTERLRDES